MIPLAELPVNNAFLWVSIVVGVVSLSQAVRSVVKYLKQDGIRQAAVDKLLATDVPEHLSEMSRTLADLQRASRSNGGQTNQVGDIAKRIETAVSDIGSKLDQHIGSNEADHKAFRRKLDTQGRKITELQQKGSER